MKNYKIKPTNIFITPHIYCLFCVENTYKRLCGAGKISQLVNSLNPQQPCKNKGKKSS